MNLISGNLADGVRLTGSSTTTNLLQGNYIGTDATGTRKLRNFGNGVFMTVGASDNQVGGSTRGAGNLISGNQGIGVALDGSAVSGNLIEGNEIGTDKTGTLPLGNDGDGIDVIEAFGNVIGGAVAGEGNLIANNLDGIFFAGLGARGNVVQGNLIGTDVTGEKALANFDRGVALDGAPLNLIGGLSTGARNVISGNGSTGISILNDGAEGNLVVGNYIGIDAAGRSILANVSSGINITDTGGNTIGGPTTSARNVISGNQGNGIHIQGSAADNNVVQGNYIGTDPGGSLALGNSLPAVVVDSGTGNQIGGDVPGAGNLISGNLSIGVYLLGAGAMANSIAGNFIGVDHTGEAPLANAATGIYVGGGSLNTVGGLSALARNVISSNGSDGIFLVGSTASMNRVVGNFIGTDAAGLTRLGNTLAGVEISGGSSNSIGGFTPPERNLISGNLDAGIFIHGASASGNLVVGNRIGTDVTGSRALGNAKDGVDVNNTPMTWIGGTEPGRRT